MQKNNNWSLKIAHLYADVMNIYGDRGNTIALKFRGKLHGIDCQIKKIERGTLFDPKEYDIVVIGGGQDREQQHISEDLVKHSKVIEQAVVDGQPMLAVCGGFQLFGNFYQQSKSQEIPGIGIFDMKSLQPEEGAQRCIGSVLLKTDFGEVVGLEDHGGRSYLNKSQKPFGTVLKGHGNNGKDNNEGARTNNAIGTYLHGSLLPRNPGITDFLLETALKRKYAEHITLEELKSPKEDAARKKERNRALESH